MSATPFRACSGQGTGKRHWSVCFEAPDRQWWRPEDMRGQMRRWSSRQAAQRFADRLSILAVELDIARKAAARIHEYARRGPVGMEYLNRHVGVRTSLWGRDPAGLFTSMIDFRKGLIA